MQQTIALHLGIPFKNFFMECANLSSWASLETSFETAAHVFNGSYYIEMFDFEHSFDRHRYIAIGKVGDVLFDEDSFY